MQIATRRWSKVWIVLFVATLPLFAVSCGGKTDATFNIAGTWSLFRVTPPVAGTETAPAVPAEEHKDLFTFTTSDNDVGGGTTTDTGATESITGSVSGNDVSFTTRPSVSGGITRDYTGKLSPDGATMSGTWTSTDTTTNTTTSGTWSAAVRGVPAFNITGNWTLTEPAGGIGGTQAFSFIQTTQTPNDLTGSTLPTTDPPTLIAGDVGSLDIMFFWKDSTGVFFTLTGKIASASAISGTWTSTDANNPAGTWSATKN